jgi:hypothetical protein
MNGQMMESGTDHTKYRHYPDRVSRDGSVGTEARILGSWEFRMSSRGRKKLPEDGTWMPKHVAA